MLASKVYFNEGRLSKNAIQREIEGSLKRLGTDYLDLYIIHRFDYDTPMEETMAWPGRQGTGHRSFRDVWVPVYEHAAYR